MKVVKKVKWSTCITIPEEKKEKKAKTLTVLSLCKDNKD
jgi:hypothetical protein